MVSFGLSAQNRRSCQLGQLGKNQFLAWIKIFFWDFWNILDISAPHKLGGGWGRQLERVFDSLRKHRNVRKHHRKSKICTSCTFVLNFSGDFQSHSSMVFALSSRNSGPAGNSFSLWLKSSAVIFSQWLSHKQRSSPVGGPESLPLLQGASMRWMKSSRM